VRGGLERFGPVSVPSLPRSPAAALEAAALAVPPAAIVVGHSFGGVLALRLAREQGIEFAALVLSDCFFPPARNGRGTVASIRDYGAHRIAYLRGLRSRAGAPTGTTSRGGSGAALRGLAGLGLRRRSFDAAADAVVAPVLVVHARDDHHVPVDFALAAAARHPDWRVELLAGGGHHAHVTEPEAWLAAVVPWLERTLSRGASLPS
jgi:pimeloyl-ACP methyl ester carboxylesterase